MGWDGESKRPAGVASHFFPRGPDPKEMVMTSLLTQLWSNDDGQDIAEYAVMLAVILVIVVGTIRLIGSNANTVFSQVASSVQ
jgi:Flp pilus assembly pilin Flp